MTSPPATRAALLAVCLAVALAVSGCGGGNGLRVGSRSVSACYRAIPRAKSASGDPAARLLGVHRLKDVSADVDFDAHLDAKVRHIGPVCAVALAGPFGAGEVEGAGPTDSGKYAVVLITVNGLRFAGGVVTDRMPKSLRGRTF